MAKGKTNNARLLVRIFEETDQIKLSEQDLDRELGLLGIESETVIAEGLRKIKDSIETNRSLSGYYMPLAASNKEDLTDNDISKWLGEDDKSRKNDSKE